MTTSLQIEFERFDLQVETTEAGILMIFEQGLEEFYTIQSSPSTGHFLAVPKVRTVFLEKKP